MRKPSDRGSLATIQTVSLESTSPRQLVRAFLFAAVLIYFLSFGPVTRYFTEVTRTQDSGETLHVTYRYPNWVYQFYYPAHWLSLTQWGHLTYGKYLRWWERPERAD